MNPFTKRFGKGFPLYDTIRVREVPARGQGGKRSDSNGGSLKTVFSVYRFLTFTGTAGSGKPTARW
jgi:hypothetical protein